MFFDIFFSDSFDVFSHFRSNKTDEALEMLGKAANMFKMSKKWGQAGNTFMKIANHHAKVI